MSEENKITLTNTEQSCDVLKGRIIAMRSMIAQFENEIKQLEGNLRSGRMKCQEYECGHIYVQGTFKYDTHTEVGKTFCIKCCKEKP